MEAKIGLADVNGLFTPFTFNRKTMSDSSPKIIVDDDWKSQVEKEKQLVAKGSVETDEPVQVAAASSDSSVTASDDSDFGAAIPPPDASFETLLTMLFTQGMAALGQLPGGPNEKMPVNKPFAKHFIDTIEMLGEKTKGNLSDQEQKMHSEVLHALRITFVSVKAPK